MTKLKWMKKIVLVAIVMLAGIWLQPMEANAQLHENAHLKVAGVEMVKKGEVLETEVEDGMGGRATYDAQTNTLTLDNFHYIEGCQALDYIRGYSMSINKKLTVVLKGTNDLRRSDRIPEGTTVENGAIYFRDHVCIEGEGKLIANTTVTIGTCEIKDCTMEINGVYYGMFVHDGLSIHNADVTISNERYCDRSAALYIEGGIFEIQDSILKVNANNGYFNSLVLKMTNDDTNHLYDSELWMKIGDDIAVTDAEGNPLNLCGGEFWRHAYFCFNKDAAAETYIEKQYISPSVHMVSAKKSVLTSKIKNVQDLIDAIGTVNLTSGEKIKAAREAYDNLSQLGEQADYAKSQVLNYEILTQAEATHAMLVQQEKDRVAAEEAKKAEEEKKKAEEESKKENENQGGNIQDKDKESSKENTPGDKIITVKKRKYVIKTPKLKSVKSAKKKTITVRYTTSKENDGYQISYSTSKKFKKSKTKTILVKSKTKKTKTLTKLKSKKNYYIKIRAYRKINGKTYYGNWSKIKKVRVK